MGANRLFLFNVLRQPIITTPVEKAPSVACSSRQILDLREVQMAEIMKKEVRDRNLNLRLYTAFRTLFR